MEEADECDDDEVYDAESLSFDEVVEQLRAWAGQMVGATMQGPATKRGNTTLFVRGILIVDDDLEVGVVDPRGGRIEAFRIGDGQVQMLEGDFTGAETTDWSDGQVSVHADFREVALNFVGPSQDR
jgi:hypothetical protein